jgi:hypothetical protein
MNNFNKKVIVTLFWLLFVSMDVFSLELWQCFSDDMTREDVLNRATIIFSDDVEKEFETNSANNQFGFPRALQRSISWSLPLPDLRITFRRNRKNSEYLQNFPGLIGVSFYFFESKLMYISLGYSGTTDELLPVLTRQFGRPIAFQYTFDYIIPQTVQAYRWEKQGRDIFLDRGSIIYFNKIYNTEYNNRRAEEERRKQQAEEQERERRRNTLNDIKL